MPASSGIFIAKNGRCETVETREYYMNIALGMAREAFSHEEVPVGCVIVSPDGEILARERNRCRERNDATAHAELLAIQEAERALGSSHLEGCSLYVTLEPCPMCVGAIVHTRISQIIFGLPEPATGCCGSVINLFEERLGHRPAIYSGVCAGESQSLLNGFFKGLRHEAEH